MATNRIHPFPARMASEIALGQITEFSKPGDLILDPMCGSGTVLETAASLGRRAKGLDLDPLAVIMSRVSCRSSLTNRLGMRAQYVAAEAREEDTSLPNWIAGDQRTKEFVEFWFAHRQRRELAQIARVLDRHGPSSDGLRLALSRTIVTKALGVSLARDTSHSRPHRVAMESDADVFARFIGAAEKIEKIIKNRGGLHANVSVRRGDARLATSIERNSIDLMVTSPPYLNAIDYLRGHRLSLVWLGHGIPELSQVRSTSIGTERRPDHVFAWVDEIAERSVKNWPEATIREKGFIRRFIEDMDAHSRAAARVLKSGGRLVSVVADSTLRGRVVENSKIVELAAIRNGFSLEKTTSRAIPDNRRYMPPPRLSDSSMAKRMKTEKVLTLRLST